MPCRRRAGDTRAGSLLRFGAFCGLLVACSDRGAEDRSGSDPEQLGVMQQALTGRTGAPNRAGSAKGWKQARADFDWSFPRDHHAHQGYRNEWWYLTGHLEDAETGTPRFGYQLTFFKVGLLPAPPELDSPWATSHLVMAHAALSDLQNETHLFSDVIYRATPQLGGFGVPSDPLLAWSLAPPGSGGRWELQWNGQAFDVQAEDQTQGFGFRLTTRPSKERIFQGPNGYSSKGTGENAASLYYSYTRLETHGEVRVDGQTHPVTGHSWMDKEFGSNLLGEQQVGWDWFSLQLQDGSDLMLYALRRPDGSRDYGTGTRVDPSGQVDYLRSDAFQVEPTRHWSSPDTGARYPVAWRLQVSGRTLLVEAAFDAQENVSRLVPGLAYWEGAVRVADPKGDPVGRGFVELTGYD